MTVGFAMLASCTTIQDTGTSEVVPAIDEIKQERTDDLNFPLLSLHIIHREHVHLTASQTENAPPFLDYLELRLIEVYPEQAYKGMLRHVAELEKNQRVKGENYQTTDVYPEDFFPYLEEPTVEQEVDSLAMDYREELLFRELDDSAYRYIVGDGGSRKAIGANHNEYIRRIGNGKVNAGASTTDILDLDDDDKTALTIYIGFFVSPLASGYMVARVYVARERAYKREKELYGVTAPQYGNKTDAFRHMFMSMMLHRYIGKSMAKVFMDWNECRNKAPGSSCTVPNSPRDEAMDKWNNAIGYDHKYRHFRARWLLDRYDWKLWSRRVRDYVDISTNGRGMPWRGAEFGEPMPVSYDLARGAIQNAGISTSTYVFYNF
jgi:hypothetical protein